MKFRSSRILPPLVIFALSLPLLAAPRLEVKTAQGKVQGKASSDGQVRDFLGIPYAAPPVGPLRWKPPQPVEKWKGVLSAAAFGKHCMQFASFSDMIFRDGGESEDCLTLNVWAPADAHGKLPVMVWIYGGGFSAGGTSEARQDGENLAKRGVIVVSMNYRLGIFGFLALPALAEESSAHATGNYGLMDQTAALRWVQQNIGAFGGDAKNVTIFGQSAGSISVSAQMASPLDQGLFARAIGESGGAFAAQGSLSFQSLAASEQQQEPFVEKALGSGNLETLRAVSADDLVKAVTHRGSGIPNPHFGPNIDGLFLPQSIPDIYAEGKQAHVPVLAGWMKDEGTSGIVQRATMPTVESLRAMAETEFGPRADEFLHAYAASNDDEAVRVAEDYAGDKFIAYSTWAWLDAQVKTGGEPVYRYSFDLGNPGDPNHRASYGAFHSDDIEYVFGNLAFRKGAAWRPEDYKLSEQMQTCWTNFARTGNPNGAGVPNWPVYQPPDWQVMHLGADSSAQPDQHRDRYVFLQQAWKH